MKSLRSLLKLVAGFSIWFLTCQLANAQQCFNNYLLSPSGNVCGGSAVMMLSGSQSGVTYQLMVNGSNYGSPVSGTGGALSLGTVTSAGSGGGGTFLVMASKFGGTCNPTIISGAGVTFVPTPDGTVSASNTEVCPGGPVTFTVNPAASALYSYQWYLGGVSIAGATAQTYTVTSAGNYSVIISNSCGSKSLTCPALTTVPNVGLLGPISGPNTRVAGTAGSSTYTVGAAANATIYYWTVAPATAGIFTGTGTSVTFTWNLNFYGTATIYAVGSNGCGAPSNTSIFSVNVDLPAAASHSYLKETDIRLPNITAVTSIPALPIGQKTVTTTYLDQAGRPIQSVDQAGSPGLNDMVRPSAFDGNGRQAWDYLPYTVTGASDGSFKATPLASQAHYYNPSSPGAPNIATSTNANSQTTFDNSPLNLVTEQGHPGTTWELGGGHDIKTIYGTNASGDVQHWTVGAGTAAASNSGFYAQGTLSSITGINENGNSVTQYFDINAHLVCKKVQSGPGTFLYTYYLYDDYGNLRYVIPPLPTVPVPVTLSYSFLESDAIFVNFIYAYHYDGRNRVIEKKVPGKGWEYFVYNKLDRVILSQTPAQLALGVWSYTKYDSKGRVVMTGNYTTASTRATLQSNADAFNSTLLSESFTNVASNYGYTDASYPDNTVAASKTVLSVKFYDGYAYLSNSTINPNSTVFTAPTVDTISSFPQSLVTGILTKVLGASSATYLLSMSQYDTHGRTVKTVTQSYKSGVASAGNYDVVQNQFSFTDLLIKSVRTHYLASSLQLTISTFYKYDAHGRKILLQQQYNSGPLTSLAKYDYNELGQLMTKNLHNVGATGIPASSVFLQHLNYKYNIRGWLNFINNPQSATLADPQFIGQTDLFAEEIDYDQPNTAYSGTAQQFSGNISTLAWQTLVNPSTGLTQETKGYVLGYDGLNRLTTAYSKAPSGNDKYDETMTYDELGNILSLNRNATPTAYLNKLSYNYGTGAQRSNQLLSVQDNGGTENYTSTFSYAPNSGNETANSKTGVTQITYNELNLVSAITFSSGKTISVLYSSTGQKLERVIKQGPTVLEDRSYISGIEYVSNTITFIRTDEGRARFNGTNYIQEYAVTDHLGNVRAMFGDEDGNNLFTSADIVQQTDYYAFGRPISLLDANPQFQYKYNGKEFSTDLTKYDYGSRYYNPVIGRWVVIDPDAELNKRYSPYNYCVNNPIRNIDPDGNQWVWNSATYMFRWEPNVYQQSDLSDATDVFVGINYLYTGTNGLRSFLSGDGNHYDGVLMGNVDLIKDFLHRPENFEPVPKNAAGDPVGYIVPKPDMVRRIDSKTLWGIGTAADLGGETTTVLYGEAGAFGTIALVAGGYPALINILNGVGNDDDLIALGLSTVTIITQLSPVGWFGDAALGAAAIYNDLRTMPEGPMIDPMTVPIGGYEGSQFYPDGYNGSGQAPATPAPDNGNEDPGE